MQHPNTQPNRHQMREADKGAKSKHKGRGHAADDDGDAGELFGGGKRHKRY